MSYEIDQTKCQKCGACFGACPFGAIAKKEDGTYEIDKSKCMTCGVCAATCPFTAIEMK